MPNTALNRTTQVLLTNKSGGALTYGAVVILDNTNTNGFTTTTTAGLSTRGLGVILEPAGIANNASGMVAVGGWCPQVNLNTAAAIGQFIKTHTVAGQGTPHASPQVEGDFAVALSASATPPCNLFGSPNGPLAGGSGTVTNTGTLTSNAVIVGNAGVDLKPLASLGTAGQVLTSAGAGTPPLFADPTSTAAEASIPSAGNVGKLFLPSDGLWLQRDTGAAWVPWGPIYPMTDPNLAGLSTWVNQGSATVSTTNGAIVVSIGSDSSPNIRARVKTAPGTPYTITAAFTAYLLSTSGIGLCWRDSGGGRLELAQLELGPKVGAYTFNSPTSFNAVTLSSTGQTWPASGVQWIRIADNGTNRTISVSGDGVTFFQVYSVARTTFVTPNQVGFYINSSAGAIAATLLSWKETA